MMKRLSSWTAPFLAVLLVWTSALADDKFTKAELDQILAPIALYPDELLTNVLIASTYPLDVVAAARWRSESANAKLTGDDLTTALEDKEWDPSIKALVQFPDVLRNMSEKLDWTQKLGDAFLAQQDQVMDEIQVLRAKADEAGHLKTTPQQKVEKEPGSGGKSVYVIEPATPDEVYVPVYQPEVVYGTWWEPDYPPYYWGDPGIGYVDGYFWGGAVAVAAGIWGWNHCDWHRHDIDIDVNKWNRINANGNKIVNNKWEHRPDRRGPVPYRNQDARNKFKKDGRQNIGNKDFRGHDRSEIQKRLKDTDHARVDGKAGQKARDRAGGRGEEGRGAGERGSKGAQRGDGARKGGDGAKKQAKSASRDRPKASGARSKQAHHAQRSKARGHSPGAFDVKRGHDVRRQASRGRASRAAMGPRAHVGGRGGGGRGFRGGGRRR